MDLFTGTIFSEGILPFLLVFVLVFAVLQKTKILGEGKSQVDALIALAIGLILIGIPTPRGYIVSIIPWLAVALVVLFTILLLYGLGGEYDSDPKKGLKIPKWFSKWVLYLAIVFVVILVLVVGGSWDKIVSWFDDSQILSNVLIVVAVAIALWVALGNKSESKED